MIKRYKNIYITENGNIFYHYLRGDHLKYRNVTETFYDFKGNDLSPTVSDIDMFIFEYSLREGLDPAIELYKGKPINEL